MKTFAVMTLSLLAVLPLAACDETPKTEAKELVDSVKQGDDAGTIGEEAKELAGAVTNSVGEVVGEQAEKAGDKVDEAIKKK